MQTRRRQIEDAASALFSSRGYAATSMRDIAKAIDLQGGSLYAHIPSKEAVLAAIVEEAAEAFHAAVRPVAERGAPAAERLREMVAAHVRVVTGGRERAKVFLFEWTFLGEERRQAVTRSRAAYQGYFERVVAEGVAGGEFGAVDPRLAAVFILSAMNAMAYWYRPDGPLGPDDLAGHYAGLFLGGLRGNTDDEGTR
ncbi:MAG TPA: TetR/AcrR family transcriptional regulator [Actinomycetes bacterium]|nr:TetR/AcrR family transcriptional regulator [Actinomycetes bacterium]